MPLLPPKSAPGATGWPPQQCDHFAESTGYNEARQMSSHNSYDGDGPKDDYDTQLEKGVRSFEVDLHLSDQHSNWDVYHTTNVFSGGDFTDNLIGFLRRMRQWHDAHPNHEVITLWLEICTFREVITLLRRPAGRPGR
jgi:hypothetical protein